MLENGGGEQTINQLIIMFLMMNRNNDTDMSSSTSRGCSCRREEGYTF